MRLTLENFRRYREETVVEFPPGLTIVTGENGAGKSTLVEGLLHALFGARTRKNPKSDGAGEPLRVRLAWRTRHVDLDARCQDSEHELWLDGTPVVRFGPRSKADACARLQGLLGGLERENFEKVYFALQGETLALVEAKPGDRKRLVEDVLQLDLVKAAVELQKARHAEAVADAKSELRALTAALAGLTAPPDVTEFQAKFGSARSQGARRTALQHIKSAAAVSLREHEQALDRLRGEETAALAAEREAAEVVETCRREFDAAEASERSFAGVAQRERELSDQIRERATEIRVLSELISALEAEVAEAASCQQDAEEHERWLGVQRQAEQALYQHQQQALAVATRDEARREWDAADTTLHSFGDAAKTLARAEDRLREALEAASALAEDPTVDERNAIDVDRQLLEQQRGEAKTALTALRDLGDARCPTCNAPLESHAKSAREQHLDAWLSGASRDREADLDRRSRNATIRQRDWQDRRAAAELAVKTARDYVTGEQLRLRDAEAAARTLEEARARWTKAERRCLSLQVPVPFDRERGVILEREAREAKDAADRLRPRHYTFATHDEKQRDLEDRQDAHRRALASKAGLDMELAGLAYDKAAHERAVETSRAMARKLADVTKGLGEVRGRLTECRDDVRAANASRDAAETAIQALERTDGGLDREHTLLEHLSNFQNHFFSANTAQVVRRASELLRPVVGNTIFALELDGDGQLYYRDVGQVRRDIDRLSGGEKAVAGLCLRLALAEQAQSIITEGQVRFLVLDEVLSSLDDQRRNQAQQILEDVLRRGVFDHIIMITHLEDVRQNWKAHRIEVTKIDEFSSTINAYSSTL